MPDNQRLPEPVWARAMYAAQDWENAILEELNRHNRLIERLLIQMRLRQRYESDEIIDQLFLNFKKRVVSGGIRVKHRDENEIIFSSRNRDGVLKDRTSAP